MPFRVLYDIGGTLMWSGDVRGTFETPMDAIRAIATQETSVLLTYHVRNFGDSVSFWSGKKADARRFIKEQIEERKVMATPAPQYTIEIWGWNSRREWVRSKIHDGYPFNTIHDALEAISKSGTDIPETAYRIKLGFVVVWQTCVGDNHRQIAIQDLPFHSSEGSTISMEGSDQMNDLLANLPKPLNVPREALIKALQVNLDKEVADREAEEKRIADMEKTVRDTIADFTIDELVEIFRRYYTNDVDTMVDAKKRETFKVEPMQPSHTETTLARAVRVLGLANDETVEIKPDSDLYKLL